MQIAVGQWAGLPGVPAFLLDGTGRTIDQWASEDEANKWKFSAGSDVPLYHYSAAQLVKLRAPQPTFDTAAIVAALPNALKQAGVVQSSSSDITKAVLDGLAARLQT